MLRRKESIREAFDLKAVDSEVEAFRHEEVAIVRAEESIEVSDRDPLVGGQLTAIDRYDNGGRIMARPPKTRGL